VSTLVPSSMSTVISFMTQCSTVSSQLIIYATTYTFLMNKHQGQSDLQYHKECVPIICILQTGVNFPLFMSRLHIQWVIWAWLTNIYASNVCSKALSYKGNTFLKNHFVSQYLFFHISNVANDYFFPQSSHKQNTATLRQLCGN
jgi:hypothetical protein